MNNDINLSSRHINTHIIKFSVHDPDKIRHAERR